MDTFVNYILQKIAEQGFTFALMAFITYFLYQKNIALSLEIEKLRQKIEQDNTRITELTGQLNLFIGEKSALEKSAKVFDRIFKRIDKIDKKISK